MQSMHLSIYANNPTIQTVHLYKRCERFECCNGANDALKQTILHRRRLLMVCIKPLMASHMRPLTFMRLAHVTFFMRMANLTLTGTIL